MLTHRRALCRVAVTLWLALGSAGLLFPGQALACSCRRVTWEEEFRTSKFIFRGVAIRIDEVDNPMTRRAAVLRVSTTWKGDAAPVMTIYTGANDADCGYPFRMGSDYVVDVGEIQEPDRTRLYTSLCHLTQLYTPALGAQLGPGKPVPAEDHRVYLPRLTQATARFDVPANPRGRHESN